MDVINNQLWLKVSVVTRLMPENYLLHLSIFAQHSDLKSEIINERKLN